MRKRTYNNQYHVRPQCLVVLCLVDCIVMQRLKKCPPRGNTVIRHLSSEESGKIAACDSLPILVLILQDKRSHDAWVLLGYGIPAIRLETGMITSRCYILELHALLSPDSTVVIIQSLPDPTSDYLAGEKQRRFTRCRQSTKLSTWRQQFPPNRTHPMPKGV